MSPRHILRLAQLAFPAIRLGRTTLLAASQYQTSYRLASRQAFHDPWQSGNSQHLFSCIELPLRSWRYFGRHRRLELILAYDAGEDTCVVVEGSVYLERAPERKRHGTSQPR
jgi:hypothetical protein